MENKLELLQQKSILGKEVNIYGDFETPLFLAKDVAEWIDYAKTDGRYEVSKMLKSVDDDEKLVGTIFLSGQNRKVWFLTESGLYEIFMQSRKPIAKEFKKEIKIMLNTVRRLGIYATPSKLCELIRAPGALDIILLELKTEQDLRHEAEQQVEILRPKAELMERVLACDQQVDIGQAAKILELPFGRNTLYAKLRDRGILFKYRNEPRQEYVDKGYFTLKEKWIEPKNHSGLMNLKVLVTQRGLEFIAQLFGVVTPPHNTEGVECEL